ncbi:site-specific integrase [Bosea sp. (in: a-proteobacteria)]|uniref:tyrosine-type recombinase/integrase n=1 Tax=Bosea sp. (in: a-proteobacteria) TaxID=1871050 RepID=UPI002B459B80|nr:site-specific integrase [Bosea sp. (in: a-proteobacteria)]WRH58609.1 MAG: site-specific integrase [Bosea sp. (in: a-proteobacteria)]
MSAIKPPDKGAVEYWDEQTRGLCLRVYPRLTNATWSFRYRARDGGGYERVTIGKLSDIGLAKAREKATALRAAVNDGGDPQKQRRTSREAAKTALRFDALAQAYIDGYAKLNKASWRNDEILLKRPRAAWKNKRPEELRRVDISAHLLEIAATAPTSANRTKTVLVKLFNWAVDAGHVQANPIAGMKKPAAESKGKDRVLSDPELKVLWYALANSKEVTQDVADALRLILLTGQRPGEIAGIEQDEIDTAVEGAWRIDIPATRMKGRRPHVVPLAPIAAGIVEAALERRAKEGDKVALLASRYYNRDTLARHSLSHALRRIIPALEAGDDRAIASLQASPPTPHDLRRTCASGMSRLGVPFEDRRAVLAHVADDVHAAHYDKYDRLAEKRKALDTWERHVMLVVSAAGRRSVAAKMK